MSYSPDADASKRSVPPEQKNRTDTGDRGTAVRVDNVSKCYTIYDTPRDRLKQFILPRIQRVTAQSPKQYFRPFWALRNVSFDVHRGETVGVIGRNGSGKSTLLQIICGTLTPTSGTVGIGGRIAALLELGSGFNPEFTGRENVYMNAAVLGLSKEETHDRFDEIAAFADIGAFIEQPVKTYSSGMVVRLAFAVAINVEPQILVVDEALSVGDELFQRKCFSRIDNIKRNGTTILLVSHSGSTVVELCDRAILLDAGELLAAGEPKAMVGKYQRLIYAPDDKREIIRNEIRDAAVDEEAPMRAEESSATGADPSTSGATEEFFDAHLKPQSTIGYEPRGAVIECAQTFNLAGQTVNCLVAGRTYRYVYRVRFLAPSFGVRFGMLIKTTSGVELGGAVSASGPGQALPYVAPDTSIDVEFRFQCNLNPGTYYMNAGVLAVRDLEEMYLHRLLDAFVFRVVPHAGGLSTGIVDFKCTPQITIRAADRLATEFTAS